MQSFKMISLSSLIQVFKNTQFYILKPTVTSIVAILLQLAELCNGSPFKALCVRQLQGLLVTLLRGLLAQSNLQH